LESQVKGKLLRLDLDAIQNQNEENVNEDVLHNTPIVDKTKI
jgi:hypothetical protein